MLRGVTKVRDQRDLAYAALNRRWLRARGGAAAWPRGPPARRTRSPWRRSTGAGAPSERLW